MPEWLTTAEQLDALPLGTVIRGANGSVAVSAQRWWQFPGNEDSFSSSALLSQLSLGWQVIWSPPITKVEWEGLVNRSGWLHSGDPVERKLLPLAGKRVRVTVEAIDEDVA